MDMVEERKSTIQSQTAFIRDALEDGFGSLVQMNEEVVIAESFQSKETNQRKSV